MTYENNSSPLYKDSRKDALMESQKYAMAITESETETSILCFEGFPGYQSFRKKPWQP